MMTYFELKKIFSRKINKIAVGFIPVILCLALYFMISDQRYVNEAGEGETGIHAMTELRTLKRKWGGELTENRIREVIEENLRISQSPEALSEDINQNDIAYSRKQGFIDIRYLLCNAYGAFNEYNYYLADELLPEQASAFYDNRIKSLETWLQEEAKDDFSQKEKEYLISQYGKMKEPISYSYQEGWKELFQYAPMIHMILSLIFGFLCSGIFAGEFQTKASAVFFTTYHGRKRAIIAKIKAAFLMITVIYVGTMISYTLLVLGLFGFDGAFCEIQSTTAGWKSMYNITNLQEYVLVIAGGYLGSLFIMGVTLLVSAAANSAVLAVAVPFVLIFLASFSGASIRILSKIVGVFPAQLLQMNLVIKQFDLYEIAGQVFPAVPLLLIGYGALTVLLFPAIYVIYRRKQVF